MSKNLTRCLIAIILLTAHASPALSQSKDQVDKINKWFDQNKDDQKKRDKYWENMHTGPLQTPGQMQKPGTLQKPGTMQIPTGWKAIKTTELPCQKRFAISGDTLFEFDRDTLTPQAVTTLNLLVPELKKQVTHPVTIEGHTDAIGPEEYNMTLSARRASRVKSWLADNKVFEATNIKVLGHGKRIPVAPNTNPDGSDNPEGRRLNRRVEIVINTCVTLDKPLNETATGTEAPDTAAASDTKEATSPSTAPQPTAESTDTAPSAKSDSTAPVASEKTNDDATTAPPDSEKKEDTASTNTTPESH